MVHCFSEWWITIYILVILLKQWAFVLQNVLYRYEPEITGLILQDQQTFNWNFIVSVFHVHIFVKQYYCK